MPIPTRHDWYQTETHVVLSLFRRNVDAGTLHVEIADDGRRLIVRVADETIVDVKLAHKVDAEVELKLAKHGPTACHWASFECPSSPSATVDAPPAYPTSSRTHHDWAAIDKAYEEDKPEGDAAVNDLFKTIYKDASDETRRAMIKSFTESNGTVLSTNWDEVGSGNVDCKPPDGMEHKKYAS